MPHPYSTTTAKPFAIAVTSPMNSDQYVSLPALADGTPVTGILTAGRPFVINVTWHDYTLGIRFEQGALQPIVEIGKTEWFCDDDRNISVCDWPQRRAYYARRQIQFARPLLEHNIIEQLIERARAWQPQLFRK